jgi:hypothetical protein
MLRATTFFDLLVLILASTLDQTEPFAEVFGQRLSVMNSPDNPLSSPKSLLQHKSPNRNLLYQHLFKTWEASMRMPPVVK